MPFHVELLKRVRGYASKKTFQTCICYATSVKVVMPYPLMEYMNETEKECLTTWARWPTGRLFVVRDKDGVIAGAAFVNDNTKALNSCNIDLIFVRPDARRKGFGSRLMRHIVTMPCKHVYATPDSRSAESKPFLAAHQFGLASAKNIIPSDWTFPGVECIWGR